MIKGMQFLCTYPPGSACPAAKPKLCFFTITTQMVRIMRLTAILLTVCFLQVKADGLSQTISFSGKDVPLQKVLEAIKKQSGYVFFYKASIMQQAKPVTMEIKNVTVEEAIRQALKGQPLEYYIENRTVVISKKKGNSTSAIEIVQKRNPDVDGLETFKKGLANVTPAVEVRSRRVGGATFQIPSEIRPERKVSMGIKWMILYARKRNEKSMAQKLAGEIVAAAKEEGGAFKKKEDVHKMAEANKAFSHFRF